MALQSIYTCFHLPAANDARPGNPDLELRQERHVAAAQEPAEGAHASPPPPEDSQEGVGMEGGRQEENNTL